MTDATAIAARRDTVYATLTELWANLRGRADQSRYWAMLEHYEQLCTDLQAALLGEAVTPERYSLCPECAGAGWVPVYDQPDDCPTCGGMGELAPPYGTPVILDSAMIAEWERGHA